MTKSLRLGPDLVLPLDFATEGALVTGMRGSGKSNSEVRWAEVLYAAGIPWVAIDPKGDWSGIRSSGDGKSAGLAVPVFGGLHGDFPLEAHMGARIADLLVDENLSAVLDVSQLSATRDRPRFLVDFCERLMHRHQVDRTVRCVILEEAHRYIPQKVPAEMARVKEATASLLLEGRAWGLGCWACTQRPARLNKDVVEEVGTVIAHRIGVAATNDLRTVGDWFKHYEIDEDVRPSLVKLRNGEAWIASPQYDLVKRVQIDRRHTFDSAATPKAGATLRRPSTMADIDQAAIKEALAESIERAKADDPAELRKQVAERDRTVAQLRAELATAEAQTVSEVPPEVVDALHDLQAELQSTPLALWRGDLAALADRIEAHHDGLSQRLSAAVAATVDGGPLLPARGRPRGGARAVERSVGASPGARAAAPPQRQAAAPRGPAERAGAPQRRPAGGAPVGSVPVPAGELTGVERKLLGVLFQLGGSATRKRFATLSNYHERAKSFTNAISHLRTLGLLFGSDVMSLTEDGLEVSKGLHVDPLPSGRALVDHWKAQPKIANVAGTILDVLYDAYPDPMPTEQLAEEVGIAVKGEGYHPRAKSFTNSLSQVRALGLVHGKGEVVLDDDLGGA